MKVLSLKQPFAYLLASSIKNIENRSWKLPEKYKGERVLIHASATQKSWEQFTNYIENLDPENLELQRIIRDNSYSKSWLNSLKTSVIIGSVRFTDCVINHLSIWAEKNHEYPELWKNPKMYESAIGKKLVYNWVVEDAVLFKEPILNVKGKLNFWDYDLPDEYVKLINDKQQQNDKYTST